MKDYLVGNKPADKNALAKKDASPKPKILPNGKFTSGDKKAASEDMAALGSVETVRNQEDRDVQQSMGVLEPARNFTSFAE